MARYIQCRSLSSDSLSIAIILDCVSPRNSVSSEVGAIDGEKFHCRVYAGQQFQHVGKSVGVTFG